MSSDSHFEAESAAGRVSVPEPVVSLRPARLGATIATHGVVDFFSFLFIPILSVLEGRLDMTHAQGAIILGVGGLFSGLVQPVVAWLGDRFDTRLLAPFSFALAVVAFSLVGFARSFEDLLVIQIIGTIGIGAFHPAAAAAVGQLAGRKRSLGVSLFFVAGMTGGVSANMLSPLLAKHFGLQNYVWLMIPGLVVVGVMVWAMARVPHRHVDAQAQRASWSEEEARGRWVAVGLLYVGNVLRFTVNMMMVQLVIRWCEGLAMSRAGAIELTDVVRENASTINGPMQGAMQIGMATGGLSAGIFLRKHHEKAALVVVPVVGAAAIVAFPYAGAFAEGVGMPGAISSLAFALAIATGVGYAGTVPVTIALAQRLLPHRTGLASGLMLGGAWGFAAIGPPVAQWLIGAVGLSSAFAVTGVLLGVAGLLSLALPGRLLASISPH